MELHPLDLCIVCQGRVDWIGCMKGGLKVTAYPVAVFWEGMGVPSVQAVEKCRNHRIISRSLVVWRKDDALLLLTEGFWFEIVLFQLKQHSWTSPLHTSNYQYLCTGNCKASTGEEHLSILSQLSWRCNLTSALHIKKGLGGQLKIDIVCAHPCPSACTSTKRR